MQFIWCLVVVLIFTTKAQADLFGSLKEGINQVQHSVNQAEANQMRHQAQSTQQSQSSDFEYGDADLPQGMYGIPFNVGLEPVLEWADRNNMSVQNFTKDSLNEEIKNQTEQQKAEAQYGTDNKQQIDYLYSLPNNPTFRHHGNEYYLFQVFQGRAYLSNGTWVGCASEAINRSVYKIELKATDKTPLSPNKSLIAMDVYFLRTQTGEFKSYLAKASFSEAQVNAAGLIEGSKLLLEVLNNKYGPYQRQKQGVLGNKDTYMMWKQRWESLGLEFNPALEILVWKNNILARGDFKTWHTQAGEEFGSESYDVIYYNAPLFATVTGIHEDAINKCKNNILQQKDNTKKSLEANF